MKMINKALTTTALAAAVFTAPNVLATCSNDAYMGSICTTAANFCPRQYAKANGDMLAISSNTALFSLIGCQFGGDCRTTFALPDLRGRSAVGSGTGIGLTEVPLGQPRGAETKVLSVASMPTHDHFATFTPVGSGNINVVIQASSTPGTSTTPINGNNVLSASTPGGTAAAQVWGTGNPDTPIAGVAVSGGGSASGTVSVGNAGASQAFSIVPPQLGVTYCIAVQGLYPSRN